MQLNDKKVDRYIYLDGVEDFAVDLFPYKIKDQNNFYFRNHPVGLNPNTFRCKVYWKSFEKHCIEGRWINDNGTWVYLMPKLFFYLNYVQISDEKRDKIYPRLMDTVIIMFSYFLCCEGFSGFDGDEEVTCNKYVGKIVRGEKLQDFEKEALEKSTGTKKPNGEYKRYVEPWEYLTETYLITNKKDKPLGNPIYDNGYYNGMMLCCRTVGKSFNTFLGLFLHEWLFSGVRKQADYKDVNNALNFGFAASETKALGRSISNLDRAYFSFPGQYDFPTKVKGKTVKYWGPFYKNTRGQWRVASGASEVKHIVKTKQGKTLINGSMVQISPIVANTETIFTGDRFRLGIIEEGGFVGNLKNIFISAQDAFKVGKYYTGSIFVIGTGGLLDKIKDAKEMFEDPESFNIFPIPNYWAKSTTVEKKCGMFVGAYYQAEELKQNGNTKLKEALLDVVIGREEERSKKTRAEFSKIISFNPIYPKELLRPTTKSPVPQQELAAWRDRLVDDKVMEKTAAIGSFKYRNGKVEFEPDLEKTMTPILEWGKDEKLEDQTGAWIIHEFPPSYIPDGLYYVLYDPYTQSGEGTSMQSILIYKHNFKTSGGDQSLQDTIVASYIGRLDTLDKAFEEPIKAALFFNARVFPEMNSIGFAEFVDRKGYQHMMQFIPKQTLEIIKGSTAASHGRSKYGYGVKVNREMNIWSINRLANWLTIPIRKDEKTQIPTWWNYQNIRDLRLLSEAANFDFENKQDFDAMSALMLLPYLLSYLDDYVVELQSEEEAYEKEYQKYSDLAKAKRERGPLKSKLSETI